MQMLYDVHGLVVRGQMYVWAPNGCSVSCVMVLRDKSGFKIDSRPYHTPLSMTNEFILGIGMSWLMISQFLF